MDEKCISEVSCSLYTRICEFWQAALCQVAFNYLNLQDQNLR